jgi:hypothetical protein
MTLDDKITSKTADLFYCKSCDFKCSKKSDYMRHITTRKHQKNDKWITLDDKKAQKNAEQFECLCGKKYIYRQGLWKHFPTKIIK